MKILLTEDEAKIAAFVEKGLSELGFTVDAFSDGVQALAAAKTSRYDALVLDIMMPGLDGLSLLKQLRAQKIQTPVILLTARTGLDDRVNGLNAGADDYLSKPFYVDELAARLHAILRRQSGDVANIRNCPPLSIDLIGRRVTLAGNEVLLTTREFNLLEYLTRQPGRVFTRVQILEHVWNYDFDPNTNVIDVYIRRIRRKFLEADSMCPDPIESVRGVGYRFKKS